MGIYFRDILLIRISRGANNCGQHSLEKNSYFIMRFSPQFQLFYFNDRLELCEFFEWKIKRINNADLFSQPPLLIFIKGANISGGHYIYIYIYIYICSQTKIFTLTQLIRYSLENGNKIWQELIVKLRQNKFILIMSDNFDRKVCNKTWSGQSVKSIHFWSQFFFQFYW